MMIESDDLAVRVAKIRAAHGGEICMAPDCDLRVLLDRIDQLEGEAMALPCGHPAICLRPDRDTPAYVKCGWCAELGRAVTIERCLRQTVDTISEERNRLTAEVDLLKTTLEARDKQVAELYADADTLLGAVSTVIENAGWVSGSRVIYQDEFDLLIEAREKVQASRWKEK